MTSTDALTVIFGFLFAYSLWASWDCFQNRLKIKHLEEENSRLRGLTDLLSDRCNEQTIILNRHKIDYIREPRTPREVKDAGT